MAQSLKNRLSPEVADWVVGLGGVIWTVIGICDAILRIGRKVPKPQLSEGWGFLIYAAAIFVLAISAYIGVARGRKWAFWVVLVIQTMALLSVLLLAAMGSTV